jgi:hypothetical protein
MNLYTMTFRYDGDFDLPDDPVVRDNKVPGMVLKKLANEEFELIDFNLSGNYPKGHAETYIRNPNCTAPYLKYNGFLMQRLYLRGKPSVVVALKRCAPEN